MAKLFDIDGAKAVLYPAYDEDCVEGDRRRRAISKVGDLPSRNRDLRRYFMGISPRPQGGMAYCSVFVGSKIPFKEMITGEVWWYQQQRMGFYERQLQYWLDGAVYATLQHVPYPEGDCTIVSVAGWFPLDVGGYWSCRQD